MRGNSIGYCLQDFPSKYRTMKLEKNTDWGSGPYWRVTGNRFFIWGCWCSTRREAIWQFIMVQFK